MGHFDTSPVWILLKFPRDERISSVSVVAPTVYKLLCGNHFSDGPAVREGIALTIDIETGLETNLGAKRLMVSKYIPHLFRLRDCFPDDFSWGAVRFLRQQWVQAIFLHFLSSD